MLTQTKNVNIYNPESYPCEIINSHKKAWETQNIQTIAEITQINFTVPSSSAKVSAIEK